MSGLNSSTLSLNSLLKIWQRGGIIDQLSAAAAPWKLISKTKAGADQGRQVNFEVLTGKGLGAIQGGRFGGTLPVGRRVSISEYTAHYKLSEATIAYDEELERRLRGGDMSYANHLAVELDAKKTGMAQIKSVECMGDGTGAIGVVTALSAASNKLVVTISATDANAGKSHIGWILESDLLTFAAATATAKKTKINGSSDLVSYYKVDSVDIANNKFICTAYSSANAVVNVTSVSTSDNPEVADLIYRNGTTAHDTTSVSDYNTCSEVMAGLETLSADDGRVVHGITMSGIMAGTRLDHAGAVLDGEAFINLLSKANQRLGAEDFASMKYKNAFMYNGTYDNLVKDGAAQRQFVNVRDVETGVDSIGARYMKTVVEFQPDPYVQAQRVFILPEKKDMLEYLGTDFEELTGGKGQGGFRGMSSNAFTKEINRFYQAGGVLLSRKPSSILSIEDFA